MQNYTGDNIILEKFRGVKYKITRARDFSGIIELFS
jgi:hypothetical protein